MLSLGSVGNAAAETKTWVGGGGDWNAPANWSPAGLPTASDHAVIASGAPLISTADVAVGSVEVTSGLNVHGRTLTVGAAAPSTVAAIINLVNGNMRLDGTTTWSAGAIVVQDAGTVENAGLLRVTGAVSVSSFNAGRKLVRVVAGGVLEVAGAGSLVVGSELENDGVVRVLDGGQLVQNFSVASPADSGGVFEALGSGVLSLGNVVMGPTSSATGSGTIRFAGGTSRVAPGAGYAAAITEINAAGVLDFDADGSTGALRMAANGHRRGDGTLTVGSGLSSLALADFAEAGTTAFTAGSQTTITDTIDFFAADHTLRLDGTTTWSAGAIVVQDAGTVENAGLLEIAGNGGVAVFGPGEKAFRNVGGTLLVLAGRSLVLSGLTLQLTGGVLAGDGTINATVSNTGGTVAPGRSPGTLTIAGNYVQTAGGTLRAEIGAPYDQLDVTGNATLNGTLALVTVPGFDPGPADTYRVLDAGARTGAFATVTGTQATPQKAYRVGYDATGVTLGIGLGPVNTARPSIPASGEPGNGISCQPGTWTATPTFAYDWSRDGTTIATGPTYTIGPADVGRSIVCRVTASDANGSGQADSNVLTPRAPPTPEPTPTAIIATVTPAPSAIPPPQGAAPPPPPTTGKTVNVATERGTVTIKLPDGRTVPLDDATQVVTGSVVDTRRGAVRLQSRGAGGKLESGVFSDGVFKVTQTRGAKPVTELQLVEPLSCPKAGRATAAAKKKKKRRVWGDAKGNFRTRGRYGSAVNTGTKWMVEDRCDRTVFRVERGTIFVRTHGTGKTVRVGAGRQHVIRG